MNPDTSTPAFLTKTELQWLNGNIQLSCGYERKIKSDIKKKIRILQEIELPLLMEKGFISQLTAVTSNCNAVTTNCNKGITGKNPQFCLLFTKQGSLGWDLDPGPLPYQGNALPG
jgi:hypothetical protein